MTVDNALSVTSKLVEEGLDLGARDVAKMYGNNCHRATVHRHMTRGHKLPDGTTVKLEAVYVCGSYRTSRQAVLRFLAALSAREQQVNEPTPAQLNREAVKATKELGAILGAR